MRRIKIISTDDLLDGIASLAPKYQEELRLRYGWDDGKPKTLEECGRLASRDDGEIGICNETFRTRFESAKRRLLFFLNGRRHG